MYGVSVTVCAIIAGAMVALPGDLVSQNATDATLLMEGSRSLRNRSLVATADPKGSSLDREIHMNIRNAPLVAVLDTISKQGKIKFIYGDDVIPSDKYLTFSSVRITVREALHRTLHGTGFLAEESSPGKVVLRKDANAILKKQQQGVQVSGKVTDSASKSPIGGAVVSIRGTRMTVQTKDDGSYLLPSVPAGQHHIDVRILGYGTKSRAITTTKDPIKADFVLSATATTLTGVVTTATGDQARLQVGNSIATIKAEDVVRDMPIRSITDLLEARAEGLTVTRASGEVGSGSRLRIRGLRSATMSNDPIVILDGIRISSEALDNDQNPNIAGKNSRPSRLDDIDPNTVESIDILKGPSAAALYGSDAANGVIIIKTKRPAAGPARWQLMADRSKTSYAASFPDVYTSYGTYVSGYRTSCYLEAIATGLCAQYDSLRSFDIMGDPLTTPFTSGHDQQISANVSGGSQALRYFLSGSFMDQLGAYKMPNVNVMAYERINGPGSAGKAMRRPSAQQNINFTGNINAAVGDNAEIAIRSTVLNRFQRRGNQGLFNAFSAANVRSEGDTITPTATNQNSVNKRTDEVKRNTTGLSANWRPRTWLSAQGSFGYDFAINNDRDFLARGICKPFCSQSAYGGAHDTLGYIYFGRRETVVKSGTLGATGTWKLPEAFTFQLSVGGQYANNRFDYINGFAGNLSAGRATPSAASGTENVEQSFDETASAGWYLQPRLSWRERVFLTAAMRQDAGSSLGADVRPLYPKWDVSYIISEESFFENIRNIANLVRFRVAFGHAGIQPASTHKLRSFSQLVRYVNSNGVLENYAQIIGVGNEDLKPERSTEIEYGADIELFDSRLRLDLTWFSARTKDAIMNKPLGPSVGTTSARRENVGNIKNSGVEANIGTTIVQNHYVSYNVNFGYSSHRNLVEELGPNVASFSLYGTIQGTDDGRVAAGYPLFGRWAKPVAGYYDANGDGIIAKSEIRYGDTLVYMGPSEPKYQFSMNHSVGFWQDRVRIAATMNYVHNFLQFNEYRANAAFQSGTWQIPATNAAELQAQAYAAAQHGVTRYGYLENTNTFRLNSVSIQTTLPNEVARRIRASQATVALIGSNVGMWTSYTGADPSVNTTATSGNRVQDNGALPMPRTWGLRFVLNY